MKIAKQIFTLPAIPLIIIQSLFIMRLMYKQSGHTEFMLWISTRERGEFTPEINKYIDSLSVKLKPIIYGVSTIGWFMILKSIF